jgi:hypothetical protein
VTNKLEEIRDAVKTKLSGATSVSDRVFGNRVRSLWRNKYPCLLVYALGENHVQRTTASPAQDGKIRTATVVIEAVAEANTDLDETLYALAAEVEQLFPADEDLAGVVASIDSQGIEIQMSQVPVAGSGALEILVGVARLTYQARYLT